MRSTQRYAKEKANSKLVHDTLDAVLHVYDIEIEQVSELAIA
jgi:hypothetical protein